MSRMVLTDELRDDYQRAFAACVIREERTAEVEALTETLLTQRARYQTVGERLNLPWFVVAALHHADTGCDFEVHPHNGDPLTDRTQHLPDGRPVDGEPPFTWETAPPTLCACTTSINGGIGALPGPCSYWRDAVVGATGLHHPEVPSPHLWNYATHYRQGKYVTDDTWNENAIAQRCGAAVLLRRLAERGLIEFTATGEPLAWPLLQLRRNRDLALDRGALTVSEYPAGIFVKVDGRAGPRTSEAFRQFTGLDWPGDRPSGHPK